MNETPTNKGMIYIVVFSVALLATLCVTTLCILSYLQIQVPPELNTLTGGLVGYLAAMLTKTTPTETIKVNKGGDSMADRDTKNPTPSPTPPPAP